MQINNNYSNINFGSFTRLSKYILRNEAKKYIYQQGVYAGVEKAIEKEEARTDRTIKVSPHRRVSMEYVPIGFRDVTIHDKVKNRTLKTVVSDGYLEDIDELLNSADEFCNL